MPQHCQIVARELSIMDALDQLHLRVSETGQKQGSGTMNEATPTTLSQSVQATYKSSYEGIVRARPLFIALSVEVWTGAAWYLSSTVCHVIFATVYNQSPLKKGSQ